jgi:hypothetical protein
VSSFQEAMQRLDGGEADLFLFLHCVLDQAAGKEGVYRACSPGRSWEC